MSAFGAFLLQSKIISFFLYISCSHWGPECSARPVWSSVSLRVWALPALTAFSVMFALSHYSLHVPSCPDRLLEIAVLIPILTTPCSCCWCPGPSLLLLSVCRVQWPCVLHAPCGAYCCRPASDALPSPLSSLVASSTPWAPFAHSSWSPVGSVEGYRLVSFSASSRFSFSGSLPPVLPLSLLFPIGGLFSWHSQMTPGLPPAHT